MKRPVLARLGAYEPLLLALALLVWLSATAGLRLLALPDEGRYVGVAWEMLRSGNWLTPTLDGLPFFHKPPLFYWMTAAALKMFGLNLWATRVASVAGAALGGFALYLFVRRWADVRLARRTVLVLAVQPLFYIGAQFANLDMLVAGCITATSTLLADAALRFERQWPARASLLGAYAMAALGVLAKGLIGVVLPGLVVAVWLLLGRRWRTLLRLLSVPGLLLLLLIAAPWFLLMQQRFPDFSHYVFVVQHFKRFAEGGFNNVQPFWFIAAVLALASLPGLPWLLRRRRDGGPDDVRLLMIVWTGCIVVFFSLPQSKLVGYVLPAVPPLAYLIAEGAPRAASRWWRASLAASLLVSLGVVAAFAIHPLRNSREFAAALRRDAGGEVHAPLIMLRQYAYDIAFYARLRDPALVVEDWSDPQLRRGDSWRKELADAQSFAPGASARLIEPAALHDTLCRQPVSYLFGETTQWQRNWPQLASARVLAQARGNTLWRVDASSLDCRGTPNAGSASK